MTRPLSPWLWFALVAAVILAASGWMGATAWTQDAKEQRSAGLALWEQKVQAALWRMDAAAAAIVAREAARKPEEMAQLARDSERLAWESERLAWAEKNSPSANRQDGKPQAESPKAGAPESAGFRFRSRSDASAKNAESRDGIPSPPPAPETAPEEARNPSARYFSYAEGKVDAKQEAKQDARLADADAAKAKLDAPLAAGDKAGLDARREALGWSGPAPAAAPAAAAAKPSVRAAGGAVEDAPAAKLESSAKLAGKTVDLSRNKFRLPAEVGLKQSRGNLNAEDQIQAQVANSYDQRAAANQAFNDNLNRDFASDRAEPRKEDAARAEPHAAAHALPQLTAEAKDGAIVLSRRVETPRLELVQGVSLDAEAVARELLPLAAADFPRGRLLPEPDPQTHASRTLAAMPLRFDPGEEPVPAVGWSPVRSALVGAGGALALAVGAIALLLARTLALSQRRAEFVSTMTHELRTPLTTFRLYTDLLEAAPEVADRSRYTQVLAREAERLSHLVENVLAYARLEHGRRKPGTQAMNMADLLAGLEPRLRERAERAGFALEVTGGGGDSTVRAHAATVEQILLNLVDNAGKYAADAMERRLVLEVSPHALALRDFGPGLDPAVRRRLFTPFSRSDKEAAGNAPGVGLGLALSRRLAREMGGDLRHEAAVPGVRFTLVLAE